MTLRDKIRKLHFEGESYDKIAEALHCSKGTISYHCSDAVKEKTGERRRKWRRKNTLATKWHNFKFPSKRDKYDCIVLGDKSFSTDLAKKIGENPRCYLTGEPINLDNPEEYSLDHIIPISRGGKSSLENCGLTTRRVNQAKNDLTLEEFYSLCEKVVSLREKL